MLRTLCLLVLLAWAAGLAKTTPNTLTVGIQPGTAPFGLVDGDGLRGIDYEIAASIAQRLGLSFRIIKLKSQKDGEDLLATGKIDVIVSHVKPSQALRERFLLSNPYYKTGLGVMVLKSNQSIFSISDLNGRSVTLTPESGAEGFVNTFAPKARIEMVKSVPDALTLLEKGDVEAIIHDSPVLLAEQNRNSGLRLLDFSFTEDNYVAVFAKKSHALLTSFNAELTRLRTATSRNPDPLSQICARYKIPSTLKSICDGCNGSPPTAAAAAAPPIATTAAVPLAPPTASTAAPSAARRNNDALLDSLLRQLHDMESVVRELKKNQSPAK